MNSFYSDLFHCTLRQKITLYYCLRCQNWFMKTDCILILLRVATNLKPQIQPITMSYDYQLLHKAVDHVKRLTSSFHATLLSEIVEVESYIRDTRPQGSLMGCKFLIQAKLDWEDRIPPFTKAWHAGQLVKKWSTYII